jgi:hypothetical protein
VQEQKLKNEETFYAVSFLQCWNSLLNEAAIFATAFDRLLLKHCFIEESFLNEEKH